MDWKFLISFAIGLALYLIFLVVFGAIKRAKNKKKYLDESKKVEKLESNEITENNENEESN